MRRLTVLAVPLLLAATACLDETPTDLDPQLARSASASGSAGSAMYNVRFYNLTEGQPLTPPLAVTHRQSISLFSLDTPAGLGVKEIAENGNLDPMLDALATEKHGADVVVTFGATIPPVLPGEMVEFDISTERGAKYFSFISMLICTNDGFAGIDSARLPRDIGSSTTVESLGYDAGTEINTEDFADIVPPCQGIIGISSEDPGTGVSNPDLAENGVVHVHEGIQGGDDLVPEVHGWLDPVVRVVIERIG
ncbi:MAG: spondin domain-containing protein [Gemmatimonadota bacterium]|nr:spondin domain-containing protein [Gemmatimonadota bacterium]